MDDFILGEQLYIMGHCFVLLRASFWALGAAVYTLAIDRHLGMFEIHREGKGTATQFQRVSKVSSAWEKSS